MKYLVFGKWDPEVEVRDPGLRAYINLKPRIVYHTQGRFGSEKFGRAKMPIIERLINTLMRGGTGKKLGGRVIRDRKGEGKKMMMYKIVEDAFELINKKTGKNPVEVLVRAIENAAPYEEVTRVRVGGVMQPIAVDISPLRRVDLALRNIGKAVAMRSWNNAKSAVQALADELIMASENNPESYAISRRNEIERIARASR